MEFTFVEGLELAEGVGNAPTPDNPGLFSRQVQPAYICLPSKIGCSGWTRTSTVPVNSRVDYYYPTEQGRCRQEFHLHPADYWSATTPEIGRLPPCCPE